MRRVRGKPLVFRAGIRRGEDKEGRKDICECRHAITSLFYIQLPAGRAFRRCAVVVEGVVTARGHVCRSFCSLIKAHPFRSPGTPFVNAPSEFTQSARAPPFVPSAAFSGRFLVFIYLFSYFPLRRRRSCASMLVLLHLFLLCNREKGLSLLPLIKTTIAKLSRVKLHSENFSLELRVKKKNS